MDVLEREEILKILGRIATSDPRDAISLAMDWEHTDPASLDLWAVGEFKRGSGNSVEIKFVDRVKALDLLLGSVGGDEDAMAGLLEALAP